MADIKQAAKWMKEGRKVRRRGWSNFVFYRAGAGGRVTLCDVGDRPNEEPGYFWPSDLLANDWEIAE